MKIVPSFLLCLTAACAALFAAEAANYAIEVRTDRPDAIYRQGEKAVFYFNVKENAALLKDAQVSWRLTKDGKDPALKAGTLTLSNGSGSLSATLQEPGFLQCRIDFKTPEGSALNNRAGAAYDPLDIRAGRSAPADFDAFWQAQKDLLKTLPLNLVLTPVESGDSAVQSYDVQADCGDTHISAYLSLPANAQPKSLPAIITLHGAGVRNANLGKTVQWAKDGFVALDFNVHGLPNDKPTAYYDALYKNELKDYFSKNRDSRDTHFFRGLYMRLMRCIDILAARPEWDGKILVAHGGSQGGAQAFAAAGLDPRVTFFCAEIPALCDLTGQTAGRTNGWPYNRGDCKNLTEQELAVAQYFDSANFAARAKAPALVTVGYSDPTCPPTTVYAAYNNIRSPKRMLAMPPVDHRSTPESLATIHQAILEHVRQMRAAQSK